MFLISAGQERLRHPRGDPALWYPVEPDFAALWDRLSRVILQAGPFFNYFPALQGRVATDLFHSAGFACKCETFFILGRKKCFMPMAGCGVLWCRQQRRCGLILFQVRAGMAAHQAKGRIRALCPTFFDGGCYGCRKKRSSRFFEIACSGSSGRRDHHATGRTSRKRGHPSGLVVRRPCRGHVPGA